MPVKNIPTQKCIYVKVELATTDPGGLDLLNLHFRFPSASLSGEHNMAYFQNELLSLTQNSR